MPKWRVGLKADPRGGWWVGLQPDRIVPMSKQRVGLKADLPRENAMSA